MPYPLRMADSQRASSSAPVRLLRVVMVGFLALAGCGGSSRDPKKANTLLQHGITAQSKGLLSEALSDYAAALKADPKNVFAQYNIGVVHQQNGELAAARDAYTKALKIDPNYKSALFNLAVLETPTNPQRAIALYRQLLVQHPEDAGVHHNLGLVLKATGHDAEGQAELDKAIQLDPSQASRGSTTTTTTAAKAPTSVRK
jgi:tetratricopeptide (TPR) repeat protein